MGIRHIDVTDLRSAQREGGDEFVLIDVRNPDEFEEVRVPGAILIPLPEVRERYDEIVSDAEVFVVCRSGARSLSACQFLVDQGIDAVNVAGGTLAWIEAGNPTDSGPATL